MIYVAVAAAATQALIVLPPHVDAAREHWAKIHADSGRIHEEGFETSPQCEALPGRCRHRNLRPLPIRCQERPIHRPRRGLDGAAP